jgi:hypothetical protein
MTRPEAEAFLQRHDMMPVDRARQLTGAEMTPEEAAAFVHAYDPGASDASYSPVERAQHMTGAAMSPAESDAFLKEYDFRYPQREAMTPIKRLDASAAGPSMVAARDYRKNNTGAAITPAERAAMTASLAREDAATRSALGHRGGAAISPAERARMTQELADEEYATEAALRGAPPTHLRDEGPQFVANVSPEELALRRARVQSLANETMGAVRGTTSHMGPAPEWRVSPVTAYERALFDETLGADERRASGKAPRPVPPPPPDDGSALRAALTEQSRRNARR